MRKLARHFILLARNRSGAVTAEFTSLIGVAALLGLAVIWAVFSDGVAPLSGQVSAEMASIGSADASVSRETDNSSDTDATGAASKSAKERKKEKKSRKKAERKAAKEARRAARVERRAARKAAKKARAAGR